MKRVNHLVLGITGGVAAVLVAACGSSTGTGSGQQQPADLQAATLSTIQSATLGDIVVDSKGHAVYRYDKDTASPSKSNCAGSCAAIWPPVLAPSGAMQLRGVDQSAIGTITRADGTKQLTLDGWPLYDFTGDAGQGETKGQAFQNIWWVITPTGEKAAAQAGSSPSSAAGSGGSGSIPGY
jgi:predicted lipoprotein with Yx(FWY)xxD motif